MAEYGTPSTTDSEKAYRRTQRFSGPFGDMPRYASEQDAIASASEYAASLAVGWWAGGAWRAMGSGFFAYSGN